MPNVNVKLTDDENHALAILKKKRSRSRRDLMREGLALLIEQEIKKDTRRTAPDIAQTNLELE